MVNDSKYKGFQIKEEILKWLLGVIYHLTKCESYTEYSKFPY